LGVYKGQEMLASGKSSKFRTSRGGGEIDAAKNLWQRTGKTFLLHMRKKGEIQGNRSEERR